MTKWERIKISSYSDKNEESNKELVKRLCEETGIENKWTDVEIDVPIHLTKIIEEILYQRIEPLILENGSEEFKEENFNQPDAESKYQVLRQYSQVSEKVAIPIKHWGGEWYDQMIYKFQRKQQDGSVYYLIEPIQAIYKNNQQIRLLIEKYEEQKYGKRKENNPPPREENNPEPEQPEIEVISDSEEEPENTEGRSTTPPFNPGSIPLPQTSQSEKNLFENLENIWDYEKESHAEGSNTGNNNQQSQGSSGDYPDLISFFPSPPPPDYQLSESSPFSLNDNSEQETVEESTESPAGIVFPPSDGETSEDEDNEDSEKEIGNLQTEENMLRQESNNYNSENDEIIANLTEQTLESEERSGETENVNPPEINLEADNQEVSQAKSISQQDTYSRLEYLLVNHDTVDNWLPEVRSVLKDIYEQEVIAIDSKKLSNKTAKYLSLLRQESSFLNAKNIKKLTKYATRLLDEVRILKVLDNYQGLKVKANLQKVLAWQDGENQNRAEVINYIPNIGNKKKTYYQLVEKELAKMGVETSHREVSSQTTSPLLGWKSRLWNTTKNVVLAASLYGEGYYQGANSTTNQLSLSTDLIPYSPCSSLDLPREYRYINKNLLDPIEVQNNYTKLKQERNQRPNITQIRYKELLAKEAQADNKLNLTQAGFDELIKEKNEWKTKYEQADLRPDNLPSDWEIKLEEWEKFKERPDIITKEYEELLLNQKPLDLPENWKAELRRISDLERQIKDLELRPNISQNEWDIIQKERNILREQLDFALDDLQHVISSNSVNEIALKQSQQALTDAQKDRDQAQNDLKTRTAERDVAIGERNTAHNELQTERTSHEKTQKSLTNEQFAHAQTQKDLDTEQTKHEKTKLTLQTTQQERDARPDITNQQWADTQQTLRQTKDDLTTAQTDLEKAQKAKQQAESNYAKEQQIHTETKTTLTETQDNLTQSQAEKQTIQNGLETLNQQLNEVNQELIREKRKERKLAKDNTHLQTQLETKTAENSEWKAKHEKLHQEQQNKDNLLERLITSLAGATASYTINRALTENDIEKLTKKVEKLREQNEQMANHWRNHRCETTCLHNDYEAIRNDLGQTRTNLNQAQKDRESVLQDRDNYQSRLATALKDKEQELTKQKREIIHQINQSLNLNLKEPNLEQLITKIQELINKPPETIYEEYSNNELEGKLNQTQATIIKLEQQLKENNTPFGESLETIKELELNSLEELFKQTVDTTIKQQIQQATSYQQVIAARQAFLEKQLGKEQSKIQEINYASNELSQPVNKERIIWIGLLLVSLVSIGGLLVKLRGRKSK